jgi:hypothetical protein
VNPSYPISRKPRPSGWLTVPFIILSLPLGWAGAAEPRTAPVFSASDSGGFDFDTGLFRGQLRPGGKSLGLISMVHVPSGKRLDQSNGILSHYRVFTKGVRYGGGAWDWPSQAKLRADGAVEVTWPSAPDRPFQMQAVYQWRGPAILDLETSVEAERPLTGFESFVAAYFSEGFTNTAVYVAKSPEHGGQPGFLPARASYGQWLMFPRDAGALDLIQDGRWTLPPHPVQWTILPALAHPLAWRRDPENGLTAVLMSRPTDCFAVASPHQTEGHHSVYFSLFGRDLKVGEVARARMQLVWATHPTDLEILKLYQGYLDSLR